MYGSPFLDRDCVGRTLRSTAQRAGLRVADEILFVRIPLDLAVQQHGDVAEVTDRRGTVSDLLVANRLAPDLDTINEVAEVALALV